jgi:hypothetical protein
MQLRTHLVHPLLPYIPPLIANFILGTLSATLLAWQIGTDVTFIFDAVQEFIRMCVWHIEWFVVLLTLYRLCGSSLVFIPVKQICLLFVGRDDVCTSADLLIAHIESSAFEESPAVAARLNRLRSLLADKSE